MSEYLKRYKIKLKTLGPVFVGSGTKINKTEYICNDIKKTMNILDMNKMFKFLMENNLVDRYTEYVMGNNKSLKNFFDNEKIPETIYKNWYKYSYSLDDSKFNSDKDNSNIDEFIKDAYSCPYIPGSSMKGALRTAVLHNGIKAKQLDDDVKTIRNGFYKKIKKANDEDSIKSASKDYDIEDVIFNVLDRYECEEGEKSALNDSFNCIHISDSKPLSCRDLILCQKIDVGIKEKNGEPVENSLNVFRECIKPNTIIEFDMTIDNSLGKIYSKEVLMESIKNMYRTYKKFKEKFKKYQKTNDTSNIYVGGGCGFGTKTINMALYIDKNCLELNSKIFTILTDEHHKHDKDIELGVSPHVLKMTKYNNRYLEFGLCSIDIEEV